MAPTTGRRWWPLVAGVVALALIVGGVAVAASRPRSPQWTTATAVTGNVTESWTSAGTVARVDQAAAAFAAVGEVTGVLVQVGDHVAAGQDLATIDPTQLHLAVVQAQAAVAQAQAQLDADQNAGSTGGAAAAAAEAAQAQAKALAQLQAQIQQLSAQLVAAKTETALTKAQLQAELQWRDRLISGLVAAATSPACVAALQTIPRPSPTTPSATAAPSTPSTPSAQPSQSASGPTHDQVVACVDAFRDLAKLAQPTPGVPSTAPGGVPTSAPGGTPSSAPGGTPSSAPIPATSQTAPQAGAAAAGAPAAGLSSEARDARVANSRASLLQAKQNLAAAERARDNATLRSPIDGQVGAVSLVEGLSSAGRTVTVVGAGAAEVTVQVPLAVRGLLAQGQRATVSPPGSPLHLDGTITRIDLLPTSTTGTPTYTATITFSDPDGQLNAGSMATVTVAVGEVAGVTVVPASAVTPTGETTGSVQVVDGATARVVTVALGARGGGRVQITDGIVPGQVVVLADRSQAVPANSFQQQRRPSASASAVSSTGATAVPSATPAR